MFKKYVQQLNRARRSGTTDGAGAEPLRYAYDAENATHRYNYSAPVRPPKEQPYSSTRAFLRAYSIVLSIAVAGVLAHTLRTYHDTRDATVRWPHGNTLGAWPVNGAQLGPTYAVIAAAAFTLVYNILALITLCRFLSKIRNGCLGRTTSALFSLFTIALWIAALAYARLPPKYSFVRTDLYNWSCKRKDMEIVGGKETVGLGLICRETTSAWALGLLVGLGELFNFVAMLSALCGGRGKRTRRSGGTLPYSAKAYRKLDVTAPGQELPMMDRTEQRGQMG